MLLSGFFFVQVQQQGSDPLVVEGTEEADRVVVIITKTKIFIPDQIFTNRCLYNCQFVSQESPADQQTREQSGETL